MSLYVASLNSGSNGNCYYVGNDEEAVLIDGGISCRETEKRMKRLGLSMEKVKALFVSHEHGDHIHGVPALSKKYKLPVYITPHTRKEGLLDLDDGLVSSFEEVRPVTIGNLTVVPFRKHHDAIDPHSFIITNKQVIVGVFTDIGHCDEMVIHFFKQCHAVFLEANYDEDMLEKGRYSLYLKNRIRNGKGHLSNKQAARLVSEHKAAHLSHLFLSHLSRNNNTHEAALDAFREMEGIVQVCIASREVESPVFHIQGNGMETVEWWKGLKPTKSSQLTLF